MAVDAGPRAGARGGTGGPAVDDATPTSFRCAAGSAAMDGALRARNYGTPPGEGTLLALAAKQWRRSAVIPGSLLSWASTTPTAEGGLVAARPDRFRGRAVAVISALGSRSQARRIWEDMRGSGVRGLRFPSSVCPTPTLARPMPTCWGRGIGPRVADPFSMSRAGPAAGDAGRLLGSRGRPQGW